MPTSNPESLSNAPQMRAIVCVSSRLSFRAGLNLAKGWIVSFEEQATEFPRGGEYSGDRFYP